MFMINMVDSFRYSAHLKDAIKVGVKKGAITGLAIGISSFFVFFVNAIALWYVLQIHIMYSSDVIFNNSRFGGYLIQYHDAAIGNVTTVSNEYV